MKIYLPQTAGVRRTQAIIVCPGSDHPETSDWFIEETVGGETLRRAVNFTVQFIEGEAEVPANLGRYMVDKKLARATKLILPKGVAA